MHHLPPSPPPPLPATDRALDAASVAFDAGHRMPLVGRDSDGARPQDDTRHDQRLRVPCIPRREPPVAPEVAAPSSAQG